MRSHAVVLGSLATVLMVLAVGYWQRQRAIQATHPQATNTTVASAANSTIQMIAAPARAWPGVSETVSSTALVDQSTTGFGQAAIATVANPETTEATESAGGTAVITALDPNTAVNVRSFPSQNADSLDYGLVGDVVSLGPSEVAEDGYTWHHVTFQDAPTTGWIRADFLDILPVTAAVSEAAMVSAAPRRDVLKEALDEHCGGPKTINAYYMTQSHIIYLCKQRHQLLYLSQEKGTEQVIVSKDAQPVGGGYVMVNDNYEYHLDSSQLIVVRIDEKDEENEVLRESVLYSERY